MNTIIRKNSMRNFSDSVLPTMVSEWNELFPSVFRGNGFSPANKIPAVDIKETESEYQVIADLPGISKEHLEVSVKANVLSLAVRSAEHTAEEQFEGRIIRQERYQGTFERSFRLNDSMDGEHIQANYKDGVLTIVVPKKEQLQPKKIEVAVH